MDAPPDLSPEQQQILQDAGDRASRVTTASRVAAFNGWTLGAFAVISLLFGLSSLVALLLGLGLAVVARNEFRGRRGLRRLEPAAARMLGRNQFGLMALIIVYCFWSMWHTAAAPLDPQMAQLEDLAGIDATLVRQLAELLYLAVIVATAIAQGLNARYYFKRVGMIESYLAETPPWVVDLQRRATID